MTRMGSGGRDERGMILLNVLVIVMLATAILAIMLAGDDDDIERSILLREASQAMATARGAELTAIAALRRDAASGRMTDTLEEQWAQIGDSDARIAGGTFSFTVADAQAKYNINALARGDALARSTFAAIAAQAGIPAASADIIADGIKTLGPIDDLSSLRIAGIDDRQLQQLARLTTALPEATMVNINTAPEPLLAILFGNAATARMIVTTRTAPGGLTPERMIAGSIVLPQGTALASDYFWARGRVTMGSTTQQLVSLLHRSKVDGKPVVQAIRKWRGAAPAMAPPLPSALQAAN